MRPARPVPRSHHCLCLRAAVWLWLAWECVWLVGSVVIVAYGATDVEGASAHTGYRLGDVLARWTLIDGHWFMEIAQHGYATRADAAFYPLYPLLVHLVAHGPLGTIVAALLVDHLALLVALVGFALLAETDAHHAGADNATQRAIVRASLLALACYPLAFFLLATLSDGVFLAAAVWATYGARAGRWWLAGVCAVLASLARPTAAPLAVLLVVEYAMQHRYVWTSRPLRWRTIARHMPACAGLASSALLGALAFAFYCQAQYHDPGAPALAERTDFGRITAGPWTGVGLVWQQWAQLTPLSYMQVRWLTDMVPLGLALLTTLALLLVGHVLTLLGPQRWRCIAVAVVRGWPLSYTLYVVAALLLILCTPIPQALFPDAYAGAGRFVLAAFPLFLLAGRLFAHLPTLGRAAVLTGVLMQAVLATYAVRGGWLI